MATFFPGVGVRVADREDEPGSVFLIIPGHELMGKTMEEVFSPSEVENQLCL